MNKLLEGQVALVTGANSGIGEGVAKCLAQEGARVAVNYVVDKDAADRVVKEITSAGGEAVAFYADISNEEDVVKMMKETIGTFGRLDILVNNAGLQRDAPFEEMTLDNWNKVIGVNLTGQFLCAREAVKIFKIQKLNREISCAAGKIICISSVHDIIPWAGHVNYAASKGGVMLLMKSMAQELAPHKIRVNSVCPGAIKTPINKDAWNTPGAEKELLRLIPYDRVGTPTDIGNVVAWLASDKSDYINGTNIYVDGGMTLYPGFATGG